MSVAINYVLADEKQSTFQVTADSIFKFPSFPPELGDAAAFIDHCQQQAAVKICTKLDCDTFELIY